MNILNKRNRKRQKKIGALNRKDLVVVRFQAIIFDFDGVLLESVGVKTEAFAEIYREFGEEVVTKVVKHHLDNGGMSRFDKFRHYHRVFLKRNIDRVELDALVNRFSKLVENAVVESQWVKGARECVEQHIGKVPMFVVSGTPEEELKRIISKRDIRHYFISVHGSPASKAQNIRSILDAHRFDARCTVMIGDSLADYDGAIEAGTQFIGRVPEGESSPFPNDVPVVTDLVGLKFIS